MSYDMCVIVWGGTWAKGFQLKRARCAVLILAGRFDPRAFWPLSGLLLRGLLDWWLRVSHKTLSFFSATELAITLVVADNFDATVVGGAPLGISSLPLDGLFVGNVLKPVFGSGFTGITLYVLELTTFEFVYFAFSAIILRTLTC